MTGLNTVKLTYWRHGGETDSSAPAWLFSQPRWLGDPRAGPDTEAGQVALARHFFAQAKAHGLLVPPMLEVGPRFPFYADFPANLDPLVGRASWLLRHLGDEPNWLRVTDRNGQSCHVLRLIETIHGSARDPETFAQGFGTAAARLKRETGHGVGRTPKPSDGRRACWRSARSTSPPNASHSRPPSPQSPRGSASNTPRRS